MILFAICVWRVCLVAHNILNYVSNLNIFAYSDSHSQLSEHQFTTRNFRELVELLNIYLTDYRYPTFHKSVLNAKKKK